MSYSAALSKGLPNTPRNHGESRQAKPAPPSEPRMKPEEHPNIYPSPEHIPQTGSEEETLYVLTLLTDKPLHERMTELRRRYFPKKLNKLAAHLTLFHALPGSRLESHIIPTIQSVTRDTSPFRVDATELFRLKKGFAISVSQQNGGRQSKQIHQSLQSPWKQEGWLSSQDAGGCRLHYTLMNKVDNEGEIQNSYDEIEQTWKGDSGLADGLALWRYDRGFWRWERKFNFKKASDERAP